jgi:plastocyanin
LRLAPLRFDASGAALNNWRGEKLMPDRDIYLKIEAIVGYSPVEPADHVTPPIQYRRDCMRNPGHEDGTIPPDEVDARRVNALIYREYLDPQYLIPKPDKLVAADVNEPAFAHRVPGTVIYASPGEMLRIHVKNADVTPHSFHVHGLRYGIDSDGAWPLGTQSADGRRSDEICPGQTWTYTYDVTDVMEGAWPFHDHCRNIGANINRGLFGGIVVLPGEERERLPRMPLPIGLIEHALRAAAEARPTPGGPVVQDPGGMDGMSMAGMGGAAVSAGAPMAGMDPVPATPLAAGGRLDVSGLSAEVAGYVATLDELSHAPQPLPDEHEVLHVPLFFHQMSGSRETPVFQSAPLNPGQKYTSPVFSVVGSYNYVCGIHGAMMSGSVTVAPGAPATVNVTIADFSFTPANVTVGTGGQVIWTNNGPSQHSVLESGGDSLPSYCFNGRSFVGNTPTIVARSGQRIRWYVFDLDLGMNWHNFHPHSQRWQFADHTIDVRSLGPAESFVADTVAPPVLLLPPEIQRHQQPGSRPPDATEYHLRGDFLVHCHVEMHMMGGLVGLVRSLQTVWLTDAEKHAIETSTGLPLDPGGNACPAVTPNRCADSSGGRWEELPGLPEITFMHAVLLPNLNRILYWGYGQRHDQARLWDQGTGLYTRPANQPLDISGDENIWSGAHAHLADGTGTILVHGGFQTGVGVDADTERRAFLFDPTTSAFTTATPLHTGRFYPTSLTLADGNPLTLFGEDHAHAAGTGVQSLEIFTPGPGGGSWSAPKTVPFNYFYYPWTFLLPGGDLFIAGPQKPARRFDPAAAMILDDPTRQYNQVFPQRGVNMDGTAVLLPLRPPTYKPRVLILGGNSPATQQTAEWIDLSAPAPTWEALPNLNVGRDKVNSVLLPDGQVMIAGGVLTLTDGGPAELFDPEDPASGFVLGPNMAHKRGYHSAAILLPDGSVVMGGDSNGGADGGSIRNERYLPSYFFKPRPAIMSSPATISHGASFTVGTPSPAAISEVVLMRAGAVTHAFNHNQRYVGCTITGASASAVQATAPPDGNIAPPGHYLLFLVDHDRVPSLGAWIQLI